MMVYVTRDATNAVNGTYAVQQYDGQEQLDSTNPLVVAFLANLPKAPQFTVDVLKDMIGAILSVNGLNAGIKNRLQAFLASLS